MSAETETWELLSKGIDEPVAHIPGIILEEFHYRLEYYDRAKLLFNNKEAIAKTYSRSPDLLKKDLHDGPKIEERLESISQRWPDTSKTKQFAKKHLPYVREFNKILQEYAASLSTKT